MLKIIAVSTAYKATLPHIRLGPPLYENRY